MNNDSTNISRQVNAAVARLLSERFAGNENHLINALYGLEVYEGVKYWEYINVDALLGLQHPKTDYPDEMTFIVYHQICELYFKLCIHEIEALQHHTITNKAIDEPEWIKRIGRVTRYFRKLRDSFDVMSIENLDTEEFFRFRMALIPASGFQTAQFRQIEIMLTDMINLTFSDDLLQKFTLQLTDEELSDPFHRIYWKMGARNERTGLKSDVIQDFEKKYNIEFRTIADLQSKTNLCQLYATYGAPESVKIILLGLESEIVNWKRMHGNTIRQHFPKFGPLKDKYGWHIDESKGTGDTNAAVFLMASMDLRYFSGI